MRRLMMSIFLSRVASSSPTFGNSSCVNDLSASEGLDPSNLTYGPMVALMTDSICAVLLYSGVDLPLWSNIDPTFCPTQPFT